MKLSLLLQRTPQLGFCDVMAAARAVLLLRLGSPSEALSHLTPHGEATEQQRNAGWRLWLTVQAKYFLGDLQVGLLGHTCTPYLAELKTKAAWVLDGARAKLGLGREVDPAVGDSSSTAPHCSTE